MAALLKGIRDPLRARFYSQFKEREERSLSLDEVAHRYVWFEMTQSFLHGTGGSVSSTSGRRSTKAEGAQQTLSAPFSSSASRKRSAELASNC